MRQYVRDLTNEVNRIDRDIFSLIKRKAQCLRLIENEKKKKQL